MRKWEAATSDAGSLPGTPRPDRRESWSPADIDRAETMSTTSTDIAGNFTKKANCVDRRVPFGAQVLLFMIPPISLLVAFSIITFAHSIDVINYIDGHEGVIRKLGTCQNAVQYERGRTSGHLGSPTPASLAFVYGARNATDTECLDLMERMSQAGDTGVRGAQFRVVQKHYFLIIRLRERVDNLNIDPVASLQQYNSVNEAIDAVRGYFANENKMVGTVKSLMQLKFAWKIANYLGHVRGAGAYVVAARDVRGKLTDDVIFEMKEKVSLYFEYTHQFEQLADEEALAFLARTRDSPVGQKADELIRGLVADPRGFNVTGADWFNSLTAALAGRSDYDTYLIDTIVSMHQGTVVQEAWKLSLSVVLALVAAWLIVWSHRRLQRRIMLLIDNSRSVKEAVQTFVPKSFLRVAGCASIVNVSVGDFNNIALTMLFSDIRDFTGISCEMSNAELFEWLQGYFGRMTMITESNNGFIEKFIGDAIFSVFKQPRNAVECAVDMQKSVQQLNLDLIASGSKYLVRVGVGVHHAVVAAGFLGDQNRVTCTLVSSEVNLASRLEGLTKYYQAQILVSSAAWDLIACTEHQLSHRYLGKVQSKGAQAAMGIVEVYQVESLSLKQWKTSTKADFENAIRLREDEATFEDGTRILARLRKEALDVGVDDPVLAFKLAQLAPVDAFNEK
jgi:class 3 adenylate cyclase